MRNYFVFDGKSSAEYDAWIASSNAFDGAEHDEEVIEIPGRNGALVFSNGRWKNFVAAVDCYISHDMRTNVDGLRAFLSSKYGYCRYEEAIKPDEFRLARFFGPFSLSASDRVGAAFTLSFDMKPQRFLKSGEIPAVYTASGRIYNPTLYQARPLVRCYGTGGTVTVNGTPVRVTGCNAYADIDCELMEVYEGTASRNGTTTLVNGAFPELDPGENAVSFSGWSRVEITPRWWSI